MTHEGYCIFVVYEIVLVVLEPLGARYIARETRRSYSVLHTLPVLRIAIRLVSAVGYVLRGFGQEIDKYRGVAVCCVHRLTFSSL